MTRMARWIPIVLLLTFFGQALFSAQRTSLTTDEILHIESGYASLTTRDYRLVEEHPPLTKMIEAWPLLYLDPPLPDPRTLPGWEEADLLTAAQAAIPPYKPLDPLVFSARVPVALLGLVLLALIRRWATSLWGVKGGNFALALAAFDPNLVAHAGVAATDLGATLGFVAAIFCFRSWQHRPNWRNALLAGIATGLALGTKTTTLLLLPIFALFLLVQRKAIHAQLMVLFIVLTAFITLWGIYGFTFGTPPALLHIPVPMPDALRPFLRLRDHFHDQHAAFLLGENYNGGHRAYFPIAFLLKTPTLTLGLLLLTTGGLLLQRLRSAARTEELYLLLPPLLYFAASIIGNINIGYRHLLPILPFLFIWLGRWGNVPFTLYWRWMARFALSSYALATLSLAPWQLSYFNLLAGGTDNGWRYLSDSNTDWGQGYKALATFERKRELSTVKLAAFITYDPSVTYGLTFEPLTPYGGFTPPIFPQRFAPPPGEYVISTTPLDGIPLADPEMYDWFRWRKPDAVIAHALHYYHVTVEETSVTWVARCTTPTIPLDDQAIAFGFGKGKRILNFDCTQSWILPPGDGAYLLDGSYVRERWSARLHYAPPPLRDTFIARALQESHAHLIYRQRRQTATRPFVIYHHTEGHFSPTPPIAYPAAADASLAALTTSGTCQIGPLQLIGISTDYRKGMLDIALWWEVLAAPPQEPLSIMGHLLSERGETPLIDDGLGYPPTQWQIGDRFAQRFRFSATGQHRWLRTGLYDLATLERLPVTGVPGADACFIPLEP